MEALKVEDKLHAQYSLDGGFYPAVVKVISEAKKRQKAPVQVQFTGYDTKEWKSIAELKSKKLQKAEAEAKFPDHLGYVVRQHSRKDVVAHVKKLNEKAEKYKDALVSKLLIEARKLTSSINTIQDVQAYFRSSGPKALTRVGSSGSPVLRRSQSTGPQRTESIERVMSIEEGKLATQVVGVCGMSSSGKSTVTKKLLEEAKQMGLYVPVLCMDDDYAAHMFEDPDKAPTKQPTMEVPTKAPNDRKWKWKNWESKKCMDWDSFHDNLGVQMAIHLGYAPFIIIEGFLMLENKQVADICDVIISLDIEKETAWQRRLNRAVENVDSINKGETKPEDDYEKIEVYAFSKDHEAIQTEAAAHVEKIGKAIVFPQRAEKACDNDLSAEVTVNSYSWLRLYFDEVIWPEAEKVQKNVAEKKREKPDKVYEINAELSKEEIRNKVSELIRDRKFAMQED